MKKFVFMALALLSLSFSSCSKDDDGNLSPTGGTTTNKEDNTIGGTSTADPGANLDGTPGGPGQGCCDCAGCYCQRCDDAGDGRARDVPPPQV